MAHFILVFLFLFACMGKLSLASIVKSLLFSAISYVCVLRCFDAFPFKNPRRFRFNFKFIKYSLWLTKEIFISAIDMAKIILAFKVKISPKIVDLRVNSQEMNSNVIYANSITLTPGTVTIALGNDTIKVYGVTKQHCDSLKASIMYKKVLGSQQ